MCPFFLCFQQFDYDEPTYGSFSLPCLGFTELSNLGVDVFHSFGIVFSHITATLLLLLLDFICKYVVWVPCAFYFFSTLLHSNFQHPSHL